MSNNIKASSGINKLRLSFILVYIFCIIIVWDNNNKITSINNVLIPLGCSLLIICLLYAIRRKYALNNKLRLALVLITIVIYVLLTLLFNSLLFHVMFCMTVSVALLITSLFIDLELS